MNTMKWLVNAAFTYMLAGLIGGVFYREFTKLSGFEQGGYTQLSTLHTHLLVLGFIVLIIVLLLEKVFGLSQGEERLFKIFFWVYNAGVVVTATIMTIHGIFDVLGKDRLAALSGIAGLGHICLGIGMFALFMLIRRALDRGAVAKNAAA